MGGVINILINSVGSLLIGILLTVLGTALMFVIIKSWYKNRTFTPLSFIVGAVLFIFLSVQSILICGAITIKGYGPEVKGLINSYVSVLPDDTDLSQQDSQQILNRLRDDLPLVGHYVGWADFAGHTPADIADAMEDELQSFMNWYILRRLLWSLLFIVLGAFLVIRSMEQDRPRRRRAGSGHARSKFYDE